MIFSHFGGGKRATNNFERERAFPGRLKGVPGKRCFVNAVGNVVQADVVNGGGGGGLGIASGLSAMLSLVVVTVAISTGEWLLTEEKLPKTSSNASVEPDSKVTYSGLWRVCVAISE